MKLFVWLNVIFILVCSSCSTKSLVLDGITGSFAIDSLYYQDDNALFYCLNLNDITFRMNNEVELPSVFDRHKWGILEDKNTEGKWEVVEINNVYKLKVLSDNKYFDGLYSIQFQSNFEKTKLILILTSENLTIYSTKDWSGYSTSKENMNKLIKINN